MVVAEAGLLGLAAAAEGTVAGLVVGVILVKVVNLQSFGWSLELVLPWSTLLPLTGWVVGACLLAVRSGPGCLAPATGGGPA